MSLVPCSASFVLRSGIRRLDSISDHIDKFGFCMTDASTDELITEQRGVFRTNCLDWYVGGQQ